MTVARGALAWLNRRSAPLLLIATTAGLALADVGVAMGPGDPPRPRRQPTRS